MSDESATIVRRRSARAEVKARIETASGDERTCAALGCHNQGELFRVEVLGVGERVLCPDCLERFLFREIATRQEADWWNARQSL